VSSLSVAPAPAAAAIGPSAAATPETVTRQARPQGGYQVRPSYPATPRRLGIQGTALLRVHVLADGRIGDVLVEKSAGHPELDDAATDAVKRWRFDPARRGSDAVAMWVLLPVEFKLR
jgi:protein TonB